MKCLCSGPCFSNSLLHTSAAAVTVVVAAAVAVVAATAASLGVSANLRLIF